MKKNILTDELKAEFEKLCIDTIFSFKSITTINPKPYPYTIGPNHIKHAADNCSGMLGEATLKAIPCAVPRCNLPYEDHTYDTVCFLQLKRDANKDEANKDIKILNDFIMKHDLAEGFCFVDTDKKFRII